MKGGHYPEGGGQTSPGFSLWFCQLSFSLASSEWGVVNRKQLPAADPAVERRTTEVHDVFQWGIGHGVNAESWHFWRKTQEKISKNRILLCRVFFWSEINGALDSTCF